MARTSSDTSCPTAAAWQLSLPLARRELALRAPAFGCALHRVSRGALCALRDRRSFRRTSLLAFDARVRARSPERAIARSPAPQVVVVNPCASSGSGAEFPCPDGSCSAGSLCSALGLAAANAPATAPTIALIGSAAAAITVGGTYAPCPPGAALSAVCEKGATASDASDGNLNPCARPRPVSALFRPRSTYPAHGSSPRGPRPCRALRTAAARLFFPAAVSPRAACLT